MPVNRTEIADADGYVTTIFNRIESVQTYLIAFTVSDFKHVENTTVIPPQRIYGKPPSIENGEGTLALKVSPEIMLGLEEYYGINYTLPKMDQIALPQFAAGAVGRINFQLTFLN